MQKSAEPIITRQEVSKAIGTSHDTLHKVKTIAIEKPELLKDIDSGKESIHSVYKKIKKEKIHKEKKEEQSSRNFNYPVPKGGCQKEITENF